MLQTSKTFFFKDYTSTLRLWLFGPAAETNIWKAADTRLGAVSLCTPSCIRLSEDAHFLSCMQSVYCFNPEC